MDKSHGYFGLWECGQPPSNMQRKENVKGKEWSSIEFGDIDGRQTGKNRPI